MPADSPLEARVRARLAELESRGLLRDAAPAGRHRSLLERLPESVDASARRRARSPTAVEREGCGSTGSRLLRGERDAFAAVERRFAGFKGTERALYFSSGYLANLAVLTTLPEAGDVVFSDERNHASLIDGIRLSRARTRRVSAQRRRRARASCSRDTPAAGHRFVVVESLFSMDGDFAPLARVRGALPVDRRRR